MTRGNNKMRIFLDDLDYAHFIGILDEVREKYELDLWLFCAMPNHYHLVLRTRRPNLSRAIRQVNGKYAQWWNKRHGRVGHAYQGRFKAQIVDQCTYLLRLCRYVLMNPVRANLVAHPWQWRWSSYAAIAGTRTLCVDVPSLLRAIDPDDGDAVRCRLLEFIEGYSDDEMASFLRKDRRVIGSDEFAAQFRHHAGRASKEVPLRERRIGTSPLAAILADAIERGAGLRTGVHDAYVAQYSIQEIAQCAGLSPASVGRIVSADLRADLGPGTSSDRFVDLTPGIEDLQT
jgi:REP element-mobilizing transposase RayT